MSIISLGVGSPASIAQLITFGLGADIAIHPTVLVDLTPPSASGDVIDADLQTNGGSDVTMQVDGTYVCNGNANESFQCRLFDDSTGDWHVMSGAEGYRVYVGGTIRLPNEDGETPLDAQTVLEGLGLTVVLDTDYSDGIAEGAVAYTDPPKYSLVNDGQTVTVYQSLGVQPASSGRRMLFYPPKRSHAPPLTAQALIARIGRILK